MTEKEKYLEWHENEVKNGLVDMKFCTGDLSEITSNTFYMEVNQMNNAEGILVSGYKDNVERTHHAESFEKVASIV